MKCELCKKEFSETVYPFHLLRCKADEPLPQKPEGDSIPPVIPESDLNQKPEEPIQPEPEIEPQPEPKIEPQPEPEVIKAEEQIAVEDKSVVKSTKRK